MTDTTPAAVAEQDEEQLAAEILRRQALFDGILDLSHLDAHGTTTDSILRHYQAFSVGFAQVQSEEGALHMALNPDGRYDPDGLRGQARLVSARIDGARDALELACGNGFNLAFLGPRHPDTRFTGLDLVPDQVERGRDATAEVDNVTFAVGDFQRLDFRDGSFDAVFAIEGLCHATDRPAVFAEIARVLRPGGKLVAVECWRTDRFAQLPAAVRAAAERTEHAMAISAATTMSAWLAEAGEAGLGAVEELDLTDQIQPSLERLTRLSMTLLDNPELAETARQHFSEEFLTNVVAGALMPLNFAIGAHTYQLVALDRRA